MSLARSLKVLPITAAVLLVATTGFAKPKTPPGNQIAQAPAPADAKPADAKPADGGPSPEARTRYNRGIELYNEGDYKLALIEFQRSYELSPNWRILYNIGEVHFQLNNYANALKALEKYVAEGGKEVPDKRREEVQKDIEALKSRTAYITITVNVPGAEITIDDNAIGKSPLAAEFLMDAGSHRIGANKAGFRAASKPMTFAGREHQSVTLDLVEEQAFVAPAPVKEDKPNYVWVGWASAGALAVGAVVTGTISLNAKSDLDDLRNKQGVTRAELDDQDSKMRTFGIATDILAGAAIVTAGVSLYFTLKGSGKSQNRTGASTTQVGITPRGVALGGTF